MSDRFVSEPGEFVLTLPNGDVLDGSLSEARGGPGVGHPGTGTGAARDVSRRGVEEHRRGIGEVSGRRPVWQPYRG